MAIRVRIAPSPTGPLHIGTARTALFNFLFARKHQGVFVLRIEDTDLERSNKAFETDIFESLRWLGLSWDEGPDVGGLFGPYRQSERTKSYTERIQQLLKNDAAYHCFCSQKELEREREQQRKKGEALRYSGLCGKRSKNEVRERLAKGELSIIRFRMPRKLLSYPDLIRGTLSFDMRLVGDIAIAKDERTPLYNFAAVVDDAEMRISHVLRGEDHIANTPKQIALAEALRIVPPHFGHFPLVLGPDRSKLSKRHGATTVKEFRDEKYPAEALVNFLALLGWNPGTEQEIFSLAELVGAFEISRVQKGGAIWNQRKLDWFRDHYIKLNEKNYISEIVPLIEKIRKSQGWNPIYRIEGVASSTIARRISPRDFNITIVDNYAYYFIPPHNIEKDELRWKTMTDEDIRRSLARSLKILKTIPEKKWETSSLEKILLHEAQEWARSEGSHEPRANLEQGREDKGKLLWPLRVALSGRKQSDSPFEIAAAIGKEGTLRRLQAAYEAI